MRMRIDQPGDHHRAFAVLAVIGLRCLVARGQDLRNRAVIVDHQRSETLHFAILADRQPFDIVDQHVCRGGRGQSERESGSEEFE